MKTSYPKSVRNAVRLAIQAGATVRELSDLAGIGRSWPLRLSKRPDGMSHRVLSSLEWAADNWRPAGGTVPVDSSKDVG